MSDAHTLKLLISGPGLIGAQHAQMVHDNDACELTAIVTPVTSRYRHLADRLNTPLYTTMKAAFESHHFDGVIISSPNEFHMEQALFCIEHNIPTLVEKPLADTLPNAHKIVEHAQLKNVPILVGHHRTYSPLLSTAKAFIESDKFGELVTVSGSAIFYKPKDYFEKGPWRTKPGGGPILINLIHEIGIMRHLCGAIQKVHAFASHHQRGFAVEDTVSINLQFDNGALGNFILSDVGASNKSWEMTSGENPNFPHYPKDNCYHFAGTNGSLDFPTMQARYYTSQLNATWLTPFQDKSIALQPKDPLVEQLIHFIEVIRGVTLPLVSCEEGYNNMLVIEAIRQSIKQERAIWVHQHN